MTTNIDEILDELEGMDVLSAINLDTHIAHITTDGPIGWEDVQLQAGRKPFITRKEYLKITVLINTRWIMLENVHKKYVVTIIVNCTKCLGNYTLVIKRHVLMQI